MSGLVRSWVAGANAPDTDFPLNNLPCGVFSTPGAAPRCGVAIGDHILDVAALEAAGILPFEGALGTGSWNAFMALGRARWDALRAALTDLLREGSADRAALEPHLVAQAGARLHLPFAVAEFTDFYAGLHHARNVGTLFRGADAALPPNWLHMPIGYNGRASSVVVSGTDIIRPLGQIKAPDDARPRLAPTQRLDFELEMGAVVGQPSDAPLSVAEAFDNIFGFVLLNDWSARDIQAWEYQPLGPFQSKATATTISPWIVTAAALDPFRTGPPPREVPLLPYLADAGPMFHDIALEVGLTPADGPETVIARTNAGALYYSAAQQLAHHSLSGCPMRVGDLLGSGTISGADRDSRGSFLELAWGGTQPVALKGGATRIFVEDHDTVSLRGAARGDGFRLGFGPCAGRVLPARPPAA